MSDIGTIWRNDPYFNNTKPRMTATGRLGYGQGISVDNAALAARFGAELGGWNGVVHPFYTVDPQAPGTAWPRIDCDTWKDRQPGPNGAELNVFDNGISGSNAAGNFYPTAWFLALEFPQADGTVALRNINLQGYGESWNVQNP